MKILTHTFVLIFIVQFCFATNTSKQKITLVDFDQLKKTKELIEQNDNEAISIIDKIISKADTLLTANYFSVTHKDGIPPSGNKHDYLTLAPYFWPNPETKDSLPYIRKDGEVNPETRNNFTDYNRKNECFKAIEILGKAFYYTEKKEYAQKAILLIDKWFLDKGTKMNPHLNYGQGIRGINDGRCFGIIEFGSINQIIMCLEILEQGKQLEPKVKKSMKNWLQEYANWLQSSELGMEESTRSNNHATWYDVQLINILIYLNQIDKVKEILELSKKRIASQIEPDGSQPHELSRTKSFSYSTMNLTAFTQLAFFGQKIGVDLWNYETIDGRSIKKAYEYLMPYITTEKEWKYQQITKKSTYADRFKQLVLYAGKTFNEPSYVEIVNNLN